jgi:hypothetical protein
VSTADSSGLLPVVLSTSNSRGVAPGKIKSLLLGFETKEAHVMPKPTPGAGESADIAEAIGDVDDRRHLSPLDAGQM